MHIYYDDIQITVERTIELDSVLTFKDKEEIIPIIEILNTTNTQILNNNQYQVTFNSIGNSNNNNFSLDQYCGFCIDDIILYIVKRPGNYGLGCFFFKKTNEFFSNKINTSRIDGTSVGYTSNTVTPIVKNYNVNENPLNTLGITSNIMSLNVRNLGYNKMHIYFLNNNVMNKFYEICFDCLEITNTSGIFVISFKRLF